MTSIIKLRDCIKNLALATERRDLFYRKAENVFITRGQRGVYLHHARAADVECKYWRSELQSLQRTVDAAAKHAADRKQLVTA